MDLILLDQTTFFLLLVAGHLFTVVLISAYWRDHREDKTISRFLLGKYVQAGSWLILALKGGIADNVTISVANTLLFVGASLETVALLYLQGAFDQRVKRYYLWLGATFVAGFHLIMLIHNVETVRIAFASVLMAAAIIPPAWQMMRGRTATLLMRIVGHLYLLVVVALFGRAGLALLSSSPMSLFDPGMIQTLLLLSLYLIMLLGNTGFALMLKEKADQELLRLASYDDLTGILNRRRFIVATKQCLAAAAANQQPVSLILFDIDRFKSVNDTYGHDVGDMVLQDLTAMVRRQLGPADLFGRYGGDEFAILLPGACEAESTERAERIRRAVEGAVERGLPSAYTISLGVMTAVPGPQTQLEQLYKACDRALYRAKDSGRNGVARG